MVLYTEQAMLLSDTKEGAIRTTSQMESYLANSYQGANSALANSGVKCVLRIVHMAQVRKDLNSCQAST